jgi:DNA-nicking Smr family endonuclease
MIMKKQAGFNKPFEILKSFTTLKTKPEQKKTSPPVAEPITTYDMSNEDIFNMAMAGTKRLEQNMIAPEPANKMTLLETINKSINSENIEVLNTLKSIVNGSTKFDIRQTGEYIEGHVISLEPIIIEKLKKGELAIQAYLDLHGLMTEEAKERVSLFIRNSYAMGYRCLMIIHGRGLKSHEGPVLKNCVINWLSSGILTSYVLAFCSARPCDGGTGAVYVLLKARPDKKKRIKRTA